MGLLAGNASQGKPRWADPSGLCRTGLDSYLQVIFPEVRDWVHDRAIPGALGKLKGKRPAYLCPAGLRRMAREFALFPAQYEINLCALKELGADHLTGASLLALEYGLLSPAPSASRCG